MGGYMEIKVDEARNLPSWAIGPFTKYKGNPVLSPSEEGWDAGGSGNGVFNGGVIVENDTFYYLYRGCREIKSKPGYLCKIGLALSDDGCCFRKYENNPLWGKDDKYSYEDVQIIKYEGTYYLFCNRWDWKCREPAINGMWLAISEDLINWKEYGIIFPHAKKIHRNGAILQNPDNEPVKVNKKFIMYLNDGLIAYSSDLIHWESKEMPRIPGGECCVAIADHSTQEPKNIVLFTGGGGEGTPWEGEHRYAIGEVLFSREAPEKSISVLEKPILYAEEKYPWEMGKSAVEPGKEVAHPDVIFFDALTRYKDKWWMYYGACDFYTCLATSPVR